MGEAGPSTHENVLYFLFSFAEPKTASKILKKKRKKESKLVQSQLKEQLALQIPSPPLRRQVPSAPCTTADDGRCISWSG